MQQIILHLQLTSTLTSFDLVDHDLDYRSQPHSPFDLINHDKVY